ncbi:MAG: glycosyltransferase family 4 protein [Deltaproteobacteria bacterium]|nr:glycosyltransferase family 4 protein [Deltaproteobacteria bacterium]
MRIGLIRMRYTPYGGAEVFLDRFMEEIVRQGHKVDLFTTGWESRDGVTIHKVRAFGPSFLRPIFFAMNVEKKLREVRPDVVLSFERLHCLDVYRAGDGCHREWLALRARSQPWWRRMMLAFSPIQMTHLFLEEEMFKSARLKKVVANSRMVKDDIIRHYGLPEDKICVIYNGIDLARYPAIDADKRRGIRESMGIPPGVFVVLFVGSGFERKGLMTLIRAIGLLKEKGDIRLVVVGKGRQGPYLREAARLGLAGRVTFAGPVKDAAEFYRAADIFALPSMYEPFSNSCLEAMALGLPVVTTASNGASEIITDGVNGGVIADPFDAPSLAGKIALFLDPDVQRAASAGARGEASKHTMKKNAAEFLKVIEDAVRDLSFNL